MISVAEAEKIIQSVCRDYGSEIISMEHALGRVLAEDILADRDFPAFTRSTMDGIALKFEGFKNGLREFKILGTQAAGDDPIDLSSADECIEIMTGAAVPSTADTVIRYEDLELQNGTARINIDKIEVGQNIHLRGADKKQGESVAKANHLIDAAIIGIAASVGKMQISVKKLPKIVIISSGDELSKIEEIPTTYQLRSSNGPTLKAILNKFKIRAELIHIPDEPESIRKEIAKALNSYDILILTGGVSMGKFDYLPQTFESLGVRKHFHKVRQKPGKPFWFGEYVSGSLVFAFPGNPVSSFMCMHRYFIPWLQKAFGLESNRQLMASIDSDFQFSAPLTYFLQVRLWLNECGNLVASPAPGHGSGDHVNLIDANAFMELPEDQNNFTKGQLFRVWPWKVIL
ncbi:MAG: molybdopterin molybdenumtransferase MoeA [Bacteroidetes bacterium]|nr:MAG: molybdopterin molybdenumtransferase MoeA [Bacteroidota bacterium]